jgi:hypothetical protein
MSPSGGDHATVAVPALLTAMSGGEPALACPWETVVTSCIVQERICVDGHGTGPFRTGRRATPSGEGAVVNAAASLLGAVGSRDDSPMSQAAGMTVSMQARTGTRMR